MNIIIIINIEHLIIVLGFDYGTSEIKLRLLLIIIHQ